MNNISETAISTGIAEFEKFKALAKDAVEQAKKAQEKANYYMGQQELLMQQKKLDDDRHQIDLRRIAELEAFITSILETFSLAEKKLRLSYHRPMSTNPAEVELDEGIRRLATASINAHTSDRIGVPEQKRG